MDAPDDLQERIPTGSEGCRCGWNWHRGHAIRVQFVEVARGRLC